MGFFDDLDKKVSKFGLDAVQKSQNISEVAQITAMIKNLEFQKKGYYEEIGRNVYQRYLVENREEDRELCRKLIATDHIIQEYKNKINKVKGVVICPTCNHVISKGNIFCSNCGTRIPKEIESVEPAFCRNCGSAVDEYAKFCVNCGSNLEMQTVERSEEPQIPDLYEKDAQIAQEGITIKICPNCGNVTEGEPAFCEECGAALDM